MTQEFIDFGAFPDDPTADAIRTAFQKTQNNFTELFVAQSNPGVISVNRTAGAGLTVNQPTGNVVLTANIACVQVSTSTLSIGRDSNGGTSATISQTSQTLVIDLPTSITTENLTANGNLLVQGTANFTGNVDISGTINLSGNLSVNNITATNTVSATNFTGTLTTNAQPNITSVGSLTNLTVTGNTTSGNFIGVFANGNSNISIPSSNGIISFGVAGNSNIAAVTGTGVTVNGNLISSNANLGNTASANYFTGTLTTGNQPNITNLGTLNGVNVSGTSNLGNLATANYFNGTLVTAAQPNITSLGTLSSLTVSGNIISDNAALGNAAAANFFIGDGTFLSNVVVAANSQIVSGTSNVRIYAPDGNVTFSVNSNANVAVITSLAANFNIDVNSNGNILANNITSNNTITANVINSNTVNATSLLGTVNTASQPNITSLGTLTGLNVLGTSNLGPASNVVITGGLNNYYLTTNGSGGLSWTSGSFSPPGGSNGDIQINNQGNLGAATGLTWNLTTNTLTATNGIIDANSFLGNYVQGTLTTQAQPNITSVGSLTSLIVNGNVNSGNIFAGNLVSANYFNGTLLTNAQPNITSLGILTSLDVNNTVTATGFTANTGVFTGNGVGLTNITGANVTGTVANATYASSTDTANTAATVTTNAQPNITSVGTLTSLIVTGNINSANLAGGNLIQGNYIQGTLTTNAQPNITSVGTLTSLSVTGNVSGGNITTTGVTSTNSLIVTTNGANITGTTNITGNLDINGNINATGNLNYENVIDLVVGDPLIYLGANNTGNLYDLGIVVSWDDGNYQHGGIARDHNTGSWRFFSNVTQEPTTVIDWTDAIAAPVIMGNLTAANATFGNSISANFLTGTLTTNSQPHVTSVGTLTSLSVTGNISSGNASLGNLASASYFTGTLTTNAQPNITSVGVLTSLLVGNITANTSFGNGTIDATGNISASYYIGNGSQLTGINGGNVSNVANANYASYAGDVVNSSQSNITSVGTLTGLNVNGNITAANITANTGVFTGNGSGLSAIAGANVTGTVANATYATSAGNATTAGTVTTNAQPNITSVGNLTGLTISNNSGVVDFTTSANVTLGNVANLHISGGSPDYVLQTNGSGTLSWVAIPSSGATITDDTTTNATYYPMYATATSGGLATAGITTTKLTFNPSTGEMTATNFNSLSDEQFKTNITPILNALETILKLEGVSYDWIDGGSSHGLLAQSVEKIISNVVSTNEGGKKTINYSAIIPFLVEAIKEQQTIIDAHTKEINELKTITQQLLEKLQGK